MWNRTVSNMISLSFTQGSLDGNVGVHIAPPNLATNMHGVHIAPPNLAANMYGVHIAPPNLVTNIHGVHIAPPNVPSMVAPIKQGGYTSLILGVDQEASTARKLYFD